MRKEKSEQKDIVEEAAERFARLLVMQIEIQERSKEKKKKVQ